MTKQDLINQGLELSALGTVVVFIALTLVVVLIYLLQMRSIWRYNKARWLNRVADNLEETVEAIDNVVFPEVKDEVDEEENEEKEEKNITKKLMLLMFIYKLYLKITSKLKFKNKLLL